MLLGDGVLLKKKCSKIECTYFNGYMNAKIKNSVAERVNLAVNAVIAKQAAAARLLLAQQTYAECRERNNPWLPGNSLLGPSRAAMWGPDPCQQEMEEIRDATGAVQVAAEAARVSTAPAPQAVAAGGGIELSNTWEASELFDSVILNAELPAELQSSWSPTGLEEVLEGIAVEMELEQAGEEAWEAMEVAEENIRKNVTALLHWDPGWPVVKLGNRFSLNLKNKKWIESWMP